MSGAGVVSAAGGNLGEIVSSMLRGYSRLAKPERIETRVDSPVGEVHLSDTELKTELGINPDEIVSRTVLLGLKAVKEAVSDAVSRGVRTNGRTVFISGTSVGGMDLSEVFWSAHRQNLDEGNAELLKMHSPGAVTSTMVKFLVNQDIIDEPSLVSTVSTACSAAGNAIMLGARMIRHGMADCAIVGGVDPLCRFTLNGFNSLRILDPEICRPFREDRAGLNLGEGAGYLVLTAESDRPYCKVSGWGNANEAYHQTASTPEGIGPGLAMKAALEIAGLEPGEIGFVNTHGTGTQVNDLAESNAMLRIFGGCVPPFSSVKPFIGHTLGASEGIEAALVCKALETNDFGFMRQIKWGRPVDETGLVPYDGIGLLHANHAMSSAFGFSGNCVSLIFSRV